MGGGIQHLNECEFLPVICSLKCVEPDGERSMAVARRWREDSWQSTRESFVPRGN